LILIAVLRRFPQHLEHVQYQTALYRKQKAELSSSSALAIYEYTRFHETSEVKVHDLGIVLMTVEHGAPRTHYFDFFADAPHDHYYTSHVWDLIFQEVPTLSQLKKIMIWSDGGLKTKENLFFFAGLQERRQVQIENHFFASYHGHSLCDAHTGTGKQQLRREKVLIFAMEEIVDVFSRLADTKTFLVQQIPRPENRTSYLLGDV